MKWKVLPSFLPSLFPSLFDSQAPSVLYSFNALCLRLCKIEVVLSSIGRKKSFPILCTLCQNDFQIILLEKMWNYVCIAWKVGCASVQVSALCILFLRKVFLIPRMSAWTFRLFVGVSWACLPHSPKFSPETLEAIEFTRFGFDKLVFSYKDIWQKNLVNSRLGRKDVRA